MSLLQSIVLQDTAWLLIYFINLKLSPAKGNKSHRVEKYGRFIIEAKFR